MMRVGVIVRDQKGRVLCCTNLIVLANAQVMCSKVCVQVRSQIHMELCLQKPIYYLNQLYFNLIPRSSDFVIKKHKLN
jgi:hypothetical protein